MKHVTPENSATESPQQRHARAMDKIAALVGVRERTCVELQRRLVGLGYTQQETDEAIESAVRCGLVSEERFTRAFIRGKTSLGWGKRKIVERLEGEGIAEELIARCSDEFASPDAELEAAVHALRCRSTSSKDPRAAYMRRLLSKGYTYETAQRAVELYLGTSEVPACLS